MQFRMSAATFFLLLSQALKPEFTRVVFYNNITSPSGFVFLNSPIVLDSTVPKGEIKMEMPTIKDEAAVSGSA